MRSALTLKELAAILAARFVGSPEYSITGVNTLDEATASDLSFLANPRYAEAMKKSQAGIICVDPTTPLPEGKNFLICENPSSAFQKIVEQLLYSTEASAFTGIHPSAVIHPSVQLGANVTVGPHTVIDQGASVGPNTVIGPNVSIYYGVSIGADCHIHANSIIREKVRIGNRVILQPGAVIGSCGFGYIQDKQGRHLKLEQLGIVILEDDVEIGANSTIDRSRFKATVIRCGTKIDNLCQIGHNVELGENNIIAAQSGVAGSTKTGKFVMMGGQVGISGHVELSDFVMIAAQSGVSKSLSAGKYRGTPAIPISEYSRHEVYVRKIKEYAERIKALENQLQALEKKFR